MGCPYEVGQREKRIIRLEGFPRLSVPPDVGRVPEIRVGYKMIVKSFLIHELSPSNIDEDTGVLHNRQSLMIDDSRRLIGQRQSQDYSIRLPQNTRYPVCAVEYLHTLNRLCP